MVFIRKVCAPPSRPPLCPLALSHPALPRYNSYGSYQVLANSKRLKVHSAPKVAKAAKDAAPKKKKRATPAPAIPVDAEAPAQAVASEVVPTPVEVAPAGVEADQQQQQQQQAVGAAAVPVEEGTVDQEL